MSTEWQELIAGERMQVDTTFRERIERSQFSNQQWSLIMTAVEFRIEQPSDPASASLEADTAALDAILPELHAVETPFSPGQASTMDPSGLPSLFGKILERLGIGDDNVDPEHEAAATALAEEYAAELQTHLEEQGRWKEICQAAAG
jgi:hypothetical protein